MVDWTGEIKCIHIIFKTHKIVWFKGKTKNIKGKSFQNEKKKKKVLFGN